jgi:hypothetical protein
MSDLIQAADTDDALTKQLRQLQANMDEIRRRVLWLEKKTAELLDGICVVMGLAVGWVVADVLVGGAPGIISGINLVRLSFGYVRNSNPPVKACGPQGCTRPCPRWHMTGEVSQTLSSAFLDMLRIISGSKA